MSWRSSSIMYINGQKRQKVTAKNDQSSGVESLPSSLSQAAGISVTAFRSILLLSSQPPKHKYSADERDNVALLTETGN
jgi:hypothetical protein